MSTLKFSLKTITLVITLGLAIGLSALASDKKNQKVIDFEDELVEGVNKRPLDSLSQISDAQRRARRNHLYRKRVGFHSETQETLHTLRYNQ